MTAMASFCWWRSILWAQIASLRTQSIGEAKSGSLAPRVRPGSTSCLGETGCLAPVFVAFFGIAPNGLDLSFNASCLFPIINSGVLGGVSGTCPLSSKEALMASLN